ncbi:hypothetical protein NXS19_011316 [Fusarium pseudograminearum]|uniref:Uncharacterized protein n=1 Tax=Fusarium pseudograminearum (strain CS3096) TaxID=1028729 RepID=K3VA50_FUSPC|nr:hypothetical protein FPSE_10821 [Fusarium pseudograminearum CS3096]EKJ69008.1 hypothetical protein FPSE_10821 [Fusarium pseudograminearum CS3096]UZP43504.1 hypothetical protein NXS19_011316 [Fusarium pseudograminearum]
MTTYTAYTQEGPTDIKALGTENYQLQVAKSVAGSDGKPSFNVVYSSHFLAPNMTVSWSVNYGLNWTAGIPNKGEKVEYGGVWQSCALGDSFNLDQGGEWITNQNNPKAKPDALNVGKNGYQIAVNIIVGVQDESGNYKPIWVSPDKLLNNSSGEYEPFQAVQIWYQENNQTSTMIGTQETPSQNFTYQDTTTFQYFSYDAQAGKWRTNQKVPFTNLP